MRLCRPRRTALDTRRRRRFAVEGEPAISSCCCCCLQQVRPGCWRRCQRRRLCPTNRVLGLEAALSLALSNNRRVKNSALEAQKSDDQVNVARSRRLPQFQVDVLAGSLLQPFDFTFPAGSFGTYPSTGPIPSTDAKIRTPAQFTTFITAAIDQPLTQQYKIDLGIRRPSLGARSLAKAFALSARRSRPTSETHTSSWWRRRPRLEAARQAVKTLEEAQRVTARVRGAADGASRRRAGGRCAPGKEPIRAVGRGERARDPARGSERPAGPRPRRRRSAWSRSPSTTRTDMTLDAARQRAAESRPEIRQAQLKETAGGIRPPPRQGRVHPDVSASVRYLGFYNFEVAAERTSRSRGCS